MTVSAHRVARHRTLLRLSLLAAAVLTGLWLFAGRSDAARYLPTTENPYCDITTYTLRDLPEQAMSTLDSGGRPVIVVNAGMLKDASSPYGHFLMAHECCHHTLGHVRRYHESLGHLGPQPFFYIAPQLKQMELDADCCAVRMLRSRHEDDAIEAAEKTMESYGPNQTGAYYPTGTERAENILNCAGQD
jgi:hypothetical protein